MAPVSRASYQSERQLRERDIKAYFKRQVEMAGARVFPWRSQGVNGVMDRVVFWPANAGLWNAVVDVVELKGPKGKLSKGQEELLMWLGRAGHRVWVITNKVEVMQYVAYHTALQRSALLAKSVSASCR